MSALNYIDSQYSAIRYSLNAVFSQTGRYKSFIKATSRNIEAYS